MKRRSAVLTAAAVSKVPLPKAVGVEADPIYDRVLAELRQRLTTRLGREFVKSQDELICSMSAFTANAVVRQPSFDGRYREAWMQYMVEELFPAIPWVAKSGPGWDQVKDNPPKPAGWALAQIPRKPAGPALLRANE